MRHSFTHYDLDIEPIVVTLRDPSYKVQDNDQEVWYNISSPQRLGIAAPVSGLIVKLKERITYVTNG